VPKRSPKKKKKQETQPRFIEPGWPVVLIGLVLLLVQVVFLPGAWSAFRLPKVAFAVTGILVVVALAAAVRLRTGGMPVSRGPLALVLLALPLLQAASALWAADPRRAVATAATSAIWIGGAFWLATLDDSQRGRIAGMTAVGTAVSALVLLTQAAGVPLLVTGTTSGSRFRMSGLTGNPADLATAAILLLPLLLVAADRRRGPWWRWIAIGGLATAALVTLTFTGYIALAALAGVWLVRRRSVRLWLITSGVFALAVALAIGAGLGNRVHRQLKHIEHGDWYSLMSARSDGWTAAAQMIRERPLLGVGAGHFDHAYYPSRLGWLEAHDRTGRRGEMATHFEWAHCDPLQLVAELGAVGALWLAALAWVIVRTRPRGDPLLPLAAAATTPFLLFHYPTHLAVGIVPIVLVLGHLLAAQPQWRLPRLAGPWRIAVPVLLAVLALAGASWQLRTVALDIWRAELERLVAYAHSVQDPAQRSQLAAAVERQVLERVDRLPGAAPWLWRIVGKARLTRNDPGGAEQAFRTANALWPHEEAELGLGLALAAQGNRVEAMLYLGRVCRVNPAIARQIPDRDLRRAVRELNRARRKAARADSR
jgi:O-antigen ligase